MSLAVNHFYRFGEFTVDLDQKVLLRNDSPLPLAPKVFDTLLILVDNSGRIVEKEELMNRLWPDSFVEESNLTFNIQQLRKALGDNARQPRFIETVARRGYRFIAPVNGNSALPGAAETELSKAGSIYPPATAGGSDRALKRSFLSIAALAVLVVGSIAIIWWFAQRRQAASSSSAPILSTPFKAEKFATGGVVRVVITPDGKYVAYTGETQGKQSIWLRQLETSENIQIVPPTDEQYLGLAISHDGNSLYFVRKTLTNPPTSAIYRVMTFGGIPVKIAEHTEGTVSASPDDKQLAFTRCNYQDEDFCSLMIIDADGKNERKLLTRQRPIRLSGNQFSPDGKSVAFASGQSWNGGSDFRLMRLDLASGAENQISPKTFFDITNLKWLPDGDGLLLAAKETNDGRLRIWHVLTATGEARALTKDATDYISLSLDKAADKMIATHVGNTFHLYLARMDDASNPKSLAVARTGVAFLPDGKIVYEGNDGDIWTINRDGGEQRQLTSNSFSDVYPHGSPDGRYIFFTSNRSGSTQVWRMNADGSNQMQLTKQEGGYPRFVSRDGKWVYFLSGLHQNLWRVPADGGEETQVSFPSLGFSPDGKFVAYFFRDKEGDHRVKLAVMSVEERKVVKIFRLADDRSHPLAIDETSGWASDNKSFYYVTRDGSRNHLWRQLLDAENPQLIGDLGDEEIAQLAVAPDGMSFALIRGRWIHDAVLIEGLK
jgi:Tol biopolymer transport system component/DNA-binding winged helix-turn-helix (wHTH) protein